MELKGHTANFAVFTLLQPQQNSQSNPTVQIQSSSFSVLHCQNLHFLPHLNFPFPSSLSSSLYSLLLFFFPLSLVLSVFRIFCSVLFRSLKPCLPPRRREKLRSTWPSLLSRPSAMTVRSITLCFFFLVSLIFVVLLFSFH